MGPNDSGTRLGPHRWAVRPSPACSTLRPCATPFACAQHPSSYEAGSSTLPRLSLFRTVRAGGDAFAKLQGAPFKRSPMAKLSQQNIPEFSCKDTCHKEVAHSFSLLVTKKTFLRVI